MRIEVTQDMIDRGVPEDCEDCPVALAIRAACPGSTELHVGLTYVEWRDGDGRVNTVLHPRELKAFILRFDAGEPVQPQTFDLPVAP